MDRFLKFFILFEIFLLQTDQLHCQDSSTGAISESCARSLYQCNNGACVNETLICDGKRDCQDGDDEENCIVVQTNRSSSFVCAKTKGQCICGYKYFSDVSDTIYLSLNCTHGGLISFPKLVNKHLINNIFLKGNKIPKLTAGIVNGSHNLESLSLPQNEINTIENNTFTGLEFMNLKTTEHLRYLDLSDNNLTKLTPGMFEHLPILFKFSLADNQISDIEKDAFKGVRVWGELFLSGNKLKKLTPWMFNNIIKSNTSEDGLLKYADGILEATGLNLKDNEISIIEPYTFSHIDQLKFLNLAGNKITKLTPGMFKGLFFLSTLHLQENQIDTIENNTFYSFSTITMLDLYRNKLTKLTPGMFNGTSLLIKSLDLKENKIDTIESYTFAKIVGLKILDLSQNKLTKLVAHTFANLLALQILSLSKNNISEIELSTFEGLFKLEVLNLTDNPLHEVDSKLFYYTTNAMSVVVDDINVCCIMNLPKCFSPTSPIDFCEQLASANTSKNQWVIGIVVFLLVITIVVAVLKFNLWGIKEKFSRTTYTATNSEDQL